MIDQRLSFSPGTRLRAEFLITDVTIPSLLGYVNRVALALASGARFADAVRAARVAFPDAGSAFPCGDSDAEIESTFGLAERLTFADEPLPSTLTFAKDRMRLSVEVNHGVARDLQRFMCEVASGRATASDLRSSLDDEMRGLLDVLLDHGLVDARANEAPALLDGSPGLTRLQHASVLYRGRDAGILVDPHLHSPYEPAGLQRTFSRAHLEGRVDAILISHGHEDHWHIPSLMTFPRDTLIVVPHVPRPTMLCPDFARVLRELGFTRVVTLPWFAPPLVVGDLEVHALPFYGEQPLLAERPRHPELRNHGNTYVVRHDSFTSWLLVDSGNDHAGTMREVARDVRKRFGPIDLLLSNLREFAVGSTSYITGGGHYWLALTPAQMRRFSSMASDVLTLGPAGVAEVCAIAGARTFLPYAHEWNDVGAPPSADELQLLSQLESALARAGAPTRIHRWRIGETCAPSGAR
jgi:L-ascorbate metabolism protein UlaG (beta-lactamase superfamily)